MERKRTVVLLCLTEWIRLIGICFRFECGCDVHDLWYCLAWISSDLKE